MTDATLLRDYVEKRDERAFAELVRRHLNVVYAAALRRTGGQRHLAEEISQKVFCDLSRKAAALTHHPALTGWLYRSTRYAAIDAARAELRRQKLAQSFTAMPDPSPASELPVDWESLRPVIDDAMDQLESRDRELMLLHYFNALTFAEAGGQLNLSEEAARKRISRALDKLRGQLARRGVTSTTAALSLLLAHPPLVAAPAGLATAVTTAALAAPASALATTVSLLFMSKITAPLLSAALAAGITAVVWTTVAPSVDAVELSALRAEHARLVQATADKASTESIASVAGEYVNQVTAIGRALAERRPGASAALTTNASAAAGQMVAASGAVTPRGHRDHGNATAQDAAMTFAWAGDVCDSTVFGRIIYFDPPAREKAAAVLATMPDAIRAQYPTPEAFYGLLLAASCLEGPPPGADILSAFQIVELQPGRVSHRAPGSTRDNWVYQQTPDGWKYVLPLAGVEGLPAILNSQTLAKLAKR